MVSAHYFCCGVKLLFYLVALTRIQYPPPPCFLVVLVSCITCPLFSVIASYCEGRTWSVGYNSVGVNEVEHKNLI
jgi:hypothetical protein